MGAIVGKALVEGRFSVEEGGGRVRSVRLIPCLDVTGGRVVKGVRFVDLTDEGDPVELAARYDAEGADEVTFLDITASSDGRDTMVSVVARTAEQVFIPLTVGGGVRGADDARRLLRAGADKVGVNTAAVERRARPRDRGRVRGPVRGRGHRRPARAGAAGWEVHTHGGRTPTARTPWPGRSSAPPTGRGRSCSPRWTATAPGTASIWRSPGPSLMRSTSRWWPREAWDAPGPGGRGGRRAGPTPSWPRRSSTGASSPSGEAKAYMADGRHRSSRLSTWTRTGPCGTVPGCRRRREGLRAARDGCRPADKQPISVLFDRVMVQISPTRRRAPLPGRAS